ncbi:unnamed protein product [Symbiodinium sp. CCMP2592]|nr:unnamed protein product [Symbiodinium sp. CCMP2592]
MSAGDPVEELTLQFSGLQITVRRTPGSVGSSAAESVAPPAAVDQRQPSERDSSTSGAQTSTGPLAGEVSPEVRTSSSGLPIDTDSENRLLEASTVAELAAHDLGTHRHLASGLATVGSWTPEARIARALRAGIGARLVLAGRTHYQTASLSLPLRNRCYVVLRCEARPEGFYTERLGSFRHFVPKDDRGRLEAGSVCHAFPSRAEAIAFVAAAQRPWPARDWDGAGQAYAHHLLCRRERACSLASYLIPGSLQDKWVHDSCPNRQLAEMSDPAVHDHPLLYVETSVEVETPRRKSAGPIVIFLVDVPSPAMRLFPTSGRGALELIPLTGSSGAVVRPLPAAARSAAEAWINEAAEDGEPDGGLAEYLTAESHAASTPGSAPPAAREEGAQPGSPADELARLRDRLAFLESQVRGATPKAAAAASPAGPPPRRGAQELFPPGDDGAGTGLTEDDWKRLRATAGAPPGRFRLDDDTLYAEAQAGALDEETVAQDLGASGSDTLQQLLAMQTQLLARLVPRTPADPISAALGSGGSGARDEGSLGSRGSVAREAFVKLMANDTAVASAIRSLAAAELGVQEAAVHPGLMRDFLERKMPLADHRLLTMVSYFAASAWEQSRITASSELEAWSARPLLFCEQAALQDGRTSLAWLLTGLGEPNWGLLTRRRSQIRPFARLCPASWVSANIAYLKEMDFIGTKMAPGATRGTDQPQPKETEDAEPPSGRKDRRRPVIGAGSDDARNYESDRACQSRAKLGTGRSEQRPNSFESFAEARPFSVSACTASLKVAASELGAPGPDLAASPLPCDTSAPHHPCHADKVPNPRPSDILLQCFPSGLPSDVVRFVPWVQSFLGLAGSARCSLGAFLRSSFSPSASPSEPPSVARGDPWPVPPPPRWRRTADIRTYGPRRRHKCKFHVLVRDLVRFLVGCLNWLVLGKPSVAPPCARARVSEFAAHQSVLEVIEHHASYFARCGDFTPDSLGRADPAVSCKPVKADRIKWSLPPSFDPLPFLSDRATKALFLEPTCFDRPLESQPSAKPAKVHCTRQELLRLARKWDAHKALSLFPCTEVDHDAAVGIFAITKDAHFDRLIINPSVANARAVPYSNFTKLLSPGSLLTLVALPAEQFLRMCADDLSEFYYTIRVPRARALRNCVRMKFRPDEIKHFSCYDPCIHTSHVYLGLNALAMGDIHAVEFAQQSHYNVLYSLAHAVRPDEFVAYRLPFPRSRCIELLAIDDHVTAQVCSRDQLKRKLPCRDSEIFAASEGAYITAGMVQHPKKRRRYETQGVYLGAEVDGIGGFVGAPRHRVAVLMVLTLAIARRGFASGALLSSVVGLWIHVVMFRRPALALLNHVFADAARSPDHVVFRLARETVNELIALAVVAPLLSSDIRASFCPAVFCMDASPDGGGLCSAPLPAHAVQELWRHSEQKGFYTKLQNPAGALLETLGLDSEPAFGAEPPKFHSELFPLQRSLSEGFLWDCIEVFTSQRNWSVAHAAAGLTLFPVSADSGRLVTGCVGDLSDAAFFGELRALALRRVIRGWHAGPRCFSCDLCREATELRLGRRLGFLMSLVLTSGCFFSIEQPVGSPLLRLDCFQRLVSLGAVLTPLCHCSFGSPFKRASLWFHNKPWLVKLAAPCSCSGSRVHSDSTGSFTTEGVDCLSAQCSPSVESIFGGAPCVGDSVSDFAATYPVALVHMMSAGSRLARDGIGRPMPCSATFETLDLLGLGGLVSSCPPTAVSLDSRPFHEDPEWICELARSLPFVELLRFRFRKRGHINVQETRTYKTWLKWCSRRHPRSRLLGLIDSRVLLGASAKGRSSSPAPCQVLQSSLPYVLGGGLYPGGLHVYSGDNAADGPSRNRSVPSPSRERPPWLRDLIAGDSFRFDVVTPSSRVPKQAARWLRLLLLLGGDIERNPGPPPLQPRGELDLQAGFASSTRHKMAKCLEGFSRWLLVEFGLSLLTVLSEVSAAALALRAYGLHLYKTGMPRYLLVYAITAVADLKPEFRAHLTPAWQIDKKWQAVEPGECRPVISLPIVQAAISVALLWGWSDWASVTLINFLCMLHPSEMIPLVRSDLVLPQDAMPEDAVAFVHVRNPKTARFARRQHSRLEDRFVLDILTARYAHLPFEARLFRGSLHTYRRQWDAIMSHLGVPCRQAARGATPGVLRGSGATYLYQETEDLGLVAWRGRWSKVKTLEFYLQEVAAQLLLQQLPASARARIAVLRSYARRLMLWSLQGTHL